MRWPRRPPEGDEELAAEIRYHLELESARQQSLGHDPVSAHARALQRFGDPALIMQATRDARGSLFIEKLMHDLRSAVRSLRKQASFTTLALITLALGIATTTTAFAVLDTVLLKPLRYRNADRLVLIREKSAKGELGSASYPNFADWRSQSHAFAGVASEMYPWAQTVNASGEPQRAIVMGVSLGFFRILGVEPFLGREFTADENKPGGAPALMVSYEFWKTQMGSRTTLGTIQFGDHAMPVVGVLPAGFRFVDEADLYFPHEQWAGTCRSCHNYRVFGRLAPAATLGAAQAEMTRLSHSLLATYGTDTNAADASVTSLRDYLVGSYRTMLTVVFGAAALVLLIACTNLVTAQLARGMSRGREMAVRAALGASQRRLVRQLFLESSILAVTGAALGGGLALVFTRVVRLVGTGLVPRLDELRVGGRALLFVGGVTVVTAAVTGIYPALRLAAGNPGGLLRGARGSSATVRGSVWRILVGFEIAMAMVLLVGSALLIRTLHNILNADTGFRAHGVVTASITVGNVADMSQVESVRRNGAALPGCRRWPSAITSRSIGGIRRDRCAGPVIHWIATGPRWPGSGWCRRNTLACWGADSAGPGFYDGRSGRERARGDRYAGDRGKALAREGRDRTEDRDQLSHDHGFGEEDSRRLAHRGGRRRGSIELDGGARRPERDLHSAGAASDARRGTAGGDESRHRRSACADSDGAGEVARVDPRHAGALRHARRPDRAKCRGSPVRNGGADAVQRHCIAAGGDRALRDDGVWCRDAHPRDRRADGSGGDERTGAAPVLTQAAAMALGGIAVGIVAGVFATKYLAATLYGVTHVDPLAYAAGAAVLLATALLGAYVPAARSSKVDPLTAIRAE